MNWLTLLKLEWRRLITNKALVVTLFGGLLLYAFLYARPYLQEKVFEQNIVAINQDHSQLSRQLLRMADASPMLKISAEVETLEQAQALIQQGKAGGLVRIPRNFYKDIQLGRSPTLSFAGDATYFLVYSTVVQNLASVSGYMAAQIKVAHLLKGGEPLVQASHQYTAINLTTSAVFNNSESYINYVLPAVFIVILHQMMLIATGLHGGKVSPQDRLSLGYPCSLTKVMGVRGMLLISIFAVLVMFYFGPVMQHYGVTQWAERGDFLALLLPFLVAVVGLGLTIAAVLPCRDYATAVGLMTSLPIVFGAGFIWPVEMIPDSINGLLNLTPAKPMVLGLLKLNQMHADGLAAVAEHFYHLWVLALLYWLAAFGLWKIKLASRS